MDTKTLPIEATDGDYSFPYLLISLDVTSVQNRVGVNVEAGMLVSVDVCTADDANGVPNMLVITLTFAANARSLRKNRLQEIKLALPKAQAGPLARKILSGATKGEGLILALEWTYCETPDDFEAQQFRKIKFVVSPEDASPFAMMILSSVQYPFDRAKPVIGVTSLRV